MSLNSLFPASAADISTFRLLVLLVLAAVGYAVASYGLKLHTMAAGFSSTGFIAFGLALAVVTEIALLRRMDLSTGYIFIIALETAFVLVAALLLGETLDMRKLAGVVLVLGGLVLVH